MRSLPEPLPSQEAFMKKSLLLVLITSVLLSTSVGCRNTAKGFGKDVERAGEKIQEKVE
jgi:predicted small secreted protein